jgi:hypothetical protein
MQRRAMHDGAADGDALHLAAGELVRIVRGAMREADAAQHFLDAIADLRFRPLRERQRKGDVLEHGQRRDEIEELEDEPDRRAPQPREPRLIERRRLRIAEKHAPARRPIDGADQIEQRRLAASGRAHQHREIARRDVERNVIEHMHRRRFVAGTVIVADVLKRDLQAGRLYGGRGKLFSCSAIQLFRLH